MAPSQSVPVVAASGESTQRKFSFVPWARCRSPAILDELREGDAADQHAVRDGAFVGHDQEAVQIEALSHPGQRFYEWKKVGKAKHPHCIRLRSGEPFALAGLWD